MKYSEFVKNVRKQLNYTQKELAEALDVSYAIWFKLFPMRERIVLYSRRCS